jgi:hypothetical protein
MLSQQKTGLPEPIWRMKRRETRKGQNQEWGGERKRNVKKTGNVPF